MNNMFNGFAGVLKLLMLLIAGLIALVILAFVIMFATLLLA